MPKLKHKQKLTPIMAHMVKQEQKLELRSLLTPMLNLEKIILLVLKGRLVQKLRLMQMEVLPMKELKEAMEPELHPELQLLLQWVMRKIMPRVEFNLVVLMQA